MTIPNFLIIGAQRSGTSSLYNYVKQHPQIFMSPMKEPRFFAFYGEEPDFQASCDREASLDRYKTLRDISITNLDDYHSLFEGVKNEKAIGEVSPIYLYSPKAPENIKKFMPEVKIIAILRDPVERAYSSIFLNRLDIKPLDEFIRAIQEEEINVENVWAGHRHCIRRGFYYIQLKRYFDNFNKNQIKVYLYDDLKNDPVGLLQNIFRFLNVDYTIVPDISKITGSSVFHLNKNKPLYSSSTRKSRITFFKSLLPGKIRQKISTCIRSGIDKSVKPALPTKIRRQLIQIYSLDFLNLHDLIHRDLSMLLEI